MSEADPARIATAEKYVREARVAIVDRRRTSGRPMHQEKAILTDVERSLAILEDHSERMREGRSSERLVGVKLWFSGTSHRPANDVVPSLHLRPGHHRPFSAKLAS